MKCVVLAAAGLSFVFPIRADSQTAESYTFRRGRPEGPRISSLEVREGETRRADRDELSSNYEDGGETLDRLWSVEVLLQEHGLDPAAADEHGGLVGPDCTR